MPTRGSESRGRWTWLGGAGEENWLSSSPGYPNAQLLKQRSGRGCGSGGQIPQAVQRARLHSPSQGTGSCRLAEQGLGKTGSAVRAAPGARASAPASLCSSEVAWGFVQLVQHIVLQSHGVAAP